MAILDILENATEMEFSKNCTLLAIPQIMFSFVYIKLKEL